MTRPGDVDDERGFLPPEEPKLELELADVPRRLPRGGVHGADVIAPRGDPATSGRASAEHAATPAPSSAASGASPAGMATGDAALPAWAGGGTAVEESPWDDPTVRVLLKVLAALAVIGALYGAYRIYRWATRPDVYAIRSPYRGSTGVTIDLPAGAGWKTDRTARVKQSAGDRWLRGEVLFRGAGVYSATELVMLMRVHAPGGFASSVDRESLRRAFEQSLQQQGQLGGSARGLSCVHEDTWRPGLGEVCYGRLTMGDRDVGLGAYLWVASDDDMIGIIYATEDTSLDALELMAKSAR